MKIQALEINSMYIFIFQYYALLNLELASPLALYLARFQYTLTRLITFGTLLVESVGMHECVLVLVRVCFMFFVWVRACVCMLVFYVCVGASACMRVIGTIQCARVLRLHVHACVCLCWCTCVCFCSCVCARACMLACSCVCACGIFLHVLCFVSPWYYFFWCRFASVLRSGFHRCVSRVDDLRFCGNAFGHMGYTEVALRHRVNFAHTRASTYGHASTRKNLQARAGTYGHTSTHKNLQAKACATDIHFWLFSFFFLLQGRHICTVSVSFSSYVAESITSAVSLFSLSFLFFFSECLYVLFSNCFWYGMLIYFFHFSSSYFSECLVLWCSHICHLRCGINSRPYAHSQ